MKRFLLGSFRLLMALAVLLGGASVFSPVSPVQAVTSAPGDLQTGDLSDYWRLVETLGTTNSPYPPLTQGDRLNGPGPIFIDGAGRLVLAERNGKRVWGFADTSFSAPVVTPGYAGMDDPFWGPQDITRHLGYTWVIDSHHLVVMDDAGAIVSDFYNFTNTVPGLEWANNYFNCATSISFDTLTGLMYVAQNCGQNPVLVLQVSMPLGPTSLALVDAFSQGDWQKHHIQAADLNNDAVSEIYLSGDAGAVQCEQPASMPGSWNCTPFASAYLHRAQGLLYAEAEHALYVLDRVDWDWGQNALRRCAFNGACVDIVTNNDLRESTNLTLDDAQDLALSAAGDFYITDMNYSVVGRLSFAGGMTYTPVFGVLYEPYVTASGYLNYPAGMVVDGDANLYVMESQGRRILSFDPAGNERWAWGRPGVWTGDEASEICSPQGTMALDPVGHLYIADRCSGRLVVLDKDSGAFLNSFQMNAGPNNEYGFNGPAGVAFSPSGRMFVSDPDNHRVQEFKYVPYAGWSYASTIGIPLTWPNPSTADGALMDPSGVAARSDTEIFIVDRSYNRVQQCTRASVTSTAWTCENFVGTPNMWGRSNYLINGPETIAIDSQGRLFVNDNNNQRIQVYDADDGTYLASIGTGNWGSGDLELKNPVGVAVDAAGNVYVGDSSNHRVQKYVHTAPPVEYLTQQGGNTWVSVRAGGRLFTGTGNRVYIYDIAADPAQPAKIGQSQALPGDIQDILVSGNFVYVITSYGHLLTLDITQPANPVLVSEALVMGDGQALAIDETASYLYALQNGPNVVVKYSLSNPAQPDYDSLHWMNNWLYDLVVRNGQAYVSVDQNGQGQILRFATLDMGGAVETNLLDTAQTARLALSGDMLYAADPGFGLYQLDTTGTNPLVSLGMDPAPRSVHLLGEYAYGLTNAYGNTYAVHLTATAMTLAGDHNIVNWRHAAECLEVGPDSSGDPLIYAPSNQGLLTYEVDTAAVPVGFSLLNQETVDFAKGWQTQVVGDTLYSIDLGIVRIFDIADPSAPVLLSSLVNPASGISPFVVRQVGAQRILYVLAWEDFPQGVIPELRTYDITDPLNLVLLDSANLQMGNSMMAVDLVDGHVVAAITEGGWWDTSVSPNEWHPGRLELFDATNAANLVALPSIETFDGMVNDIAIQDSYVFVTEQNNPQNAPDGLSNNHGGGGGLRVYDLEGIFDPIPAPPALRTVLGSGDAQEIDIVGNTVYQTDMWQGLWALTIDPAADPAAWNYRRLLALNNDTFEVQVINRDGATYAVVLNSREMYIYEVVSLAPDQLRDVTVYLLPFYTNGAEMSEAMPFLWMSGWGQGMSGWWAAPTLERVVSAPATTVTSSLDDVSYTFANEALRIWHTPVFQGNLPAAPAGLLGIGRAFETVARHPQTEQPVVLNAPYTLTVGYDPAKLGAVDEGSLKLYYWSGTAWMVEPSTLDRAANTLTAHPNHFSYWSVLGAEDTDNPSGTVTINSGAEYAVDPDVILALTATDPTTSVVSMRFNEDGGAWTAWEDFNASKSFTLTGGEGLRTVYAQFIDEAGNLSASASDTITLDTNAPTGNSVTVNGGEFVNITAVTLTPASSGAAWMRFSEDNSFTGASWIAYSATAQNFTLSGGDGLKTVFAQYQDDAGNLSGVVNDTVTLDTAAPTANVVTINGGEFVNTTAVTLTPASSGAAWMRFSEDSGFGSASWTAYSAAAQNFTLSGGDGLKTVFAQYRDAAGNLSPLASDTVTLDTKLPLGMFVINAGDAMTQLPAVTLQINAGEDVTRMRFMETNGPWPSDWSASSLFAATAPFTLTGADGIKTVYAQFLDHAGNVSTVEISDTIMLDTAGPTGAGSILIDSGAAFTNQVEVWLTLTPTDAWSGVSQMRVSNAADGTGGVWTEFSGYTPWTLPGVEGLQTVYVWYRDGVGNETGPFSDDITYDASVPSGSVSIAGGAATTTTQTVALGFTHAGVETGLQMRVNNSVSALTGTTWSPYAASMPGWALTVGNGVKSVFAQFKDSAGNLSPVYEDTIMFDDAAPTGSLYINGTAALANDPDVDLFITFTESGSGVVNLRAAASETGLAAASYAVYANPLPWTLSGDDGTHTVCVQLQDAAGNESAAMCDTITLDTTAPVGSLSINGGSAETISTAVTLTLTANDATSGMGFVMVSNLPNFLGAEWQPYAASLAWALAGDSGTNTVYVKYMDLAGNATDPIEESIVFREAFEIYLPMLRR